MASIIPTLRFIANHPLSSKRPLSAYWRYGRWQIESRLRREVEFPWIEGSKLVARNGMTGATGNIYCGLHEFEDMAFLLHLLRPDDLFVDIGANIGSYTVLASAVCDARSISVEPDPGTMESLKRNVEANRIGESVRLIQAALGAASGSVRFTVGQDTTNRVAGEADANTRDVEVRTLDEILKSQKPTLIKMDVEGYEPEVIAGGVKTLEVPSLLAVITETADVRVCGALETAGFQRAYYEPFQRDLSLSVPHTGGGALRNALFVRNVDACRARLKAAPRRAVLGHAI